MLSLPRRIETRKTKYQHDIWECMNFACTYVASSFSSAFIKCCWISWATPGCGGYGTTPLHQGSVWKPGRDTYLRPGRSLLLCPNMVLAASFGRSIYSSLIPFRFCFEKKVRLRNTCRSADSILGSDVDWWVRTVFARLLMEVTAALMKMDIRC